jgi:PAS domain S-box-containing protein
MYEATPIAEEMLRTAARAVAEGGEQLSSVLDALDAPIYVTDASGLVTHFNRACIGFSGRTPAVGKDHWCVTWKLYTDAGAALPHGACPMAVAIRERRPIRGETAIAERPNGERVAFLPLPTPIFDRDGALVGAVNMLVDVTDLRQADALRVRAERCRRLARGLSDRRAAEVLNAMAAEHAEKASELEHANRLVGVA